MISLCSTLKVAPFSVQTLLMCSDVDLYLPEYVTCSAFLWNNKVNKFQHVDFSQTINLD